MASNSLHFAMPVASCKHQLAQHMIHPHNQNKSVHAHAVLVGKRHKASTKGMLSINPPLKRSATQWTNMFSAIFAQWQPDIHIALFGLMLSVQVHPTGSAIWSMQGMVHYAHFHQQHSKQQMPQQCRRASKLCIKEAGNTTLKKHISLQNHCGNMDSQLLISLPLFCHQLPCIGSVLLNWDHVLGSSHVEWRLPSPLSLPCCGCFENNSLHQTCQSTSSNKSSVLMAGSVIHNNSWTMHFQFSIEWRSCVLHHNNTHQSSGTVWGHARVVPVPDPIHSSNQSVTHQQSIFFSTHQEQSTTEAIHSVANVSTQQQRQEQIN